MPPEITNWGAFKSEWNKFIELGLVADLLPVVSNPGASISPNSKMKALGKTPSFYNGEGYVTGFSKWTEYEATISDIAKWSKESNYGICLQTRAVRAFDIDVEDKEKAAEIEQFIYDFLEYKIPCRYRKNSGKKLLAFKMFGEFRKRILPVDGGMIEFLATGQQFVAAGEHTSGMRYEWEWNGHDNFPELPAGLFENLWFSLAEMFGIAPPVQRGTRNKRTTANVDIFDDTLEYLERKGLVLGYGAEGQAFIACPFGDQHTTESSESSTCYFLKGTRGYEQGHFKCLHAHCEGRRDYEFLDALGKFAEEMEVLPDEESQPRLYCDDKGTPYATISNVTTAIRHPGMIGCVPCYDNFRDELLIYNLDRTEWKQITDEDYTCFRIKLETQFRFKVILPQTMRDAVRVVAKENAIDTALEWLNSLQEWDGNPRVERFLCDYFGADDNEYTRAISMYLWTGLAGRIIEPGVKCDMVPIAKGRQGLGKSTAIAAIAPSLDQFCEIDLSESDADRSRKMRGVLIAEISELRGMKTKAVESIKAFVARQKENWVPKYREHSTSYPRRTILMATTNEDCFLADDTGNRRWLPFEVVRATNPEAIKRDREQLWAEAAYFFRLTGEVDYKPAERLAQKEHEKYEIRDIWEERIEEWLHTLDEETGRKPIDEDFIPTDMIARFALGIDSLKHRTSDDMRIAKIMRRLGHEDSRKMRSGIRKHGWSKKD